MEDKEAIDFIKEAIKHMETQLRAPLRINDWRGGNYDADEDRYGGMGVYFDDTLALDEVNKSAGKLERGDASFKVEFAEWVFNADHLVIDDQLHIGDLPHEYKVVCRCGYCIHGEWMRWRKKYWPDLPTKIN